MNSGDILYSLKPASWYRDLWREAFASGSGMVAMLSYGHVGDETVILNHAALWHHQKKMEVPVIHGALKRTRELMDEGKYHEANWVITNALKDKGFQTALGAPFPVCALQFRKESQISYRHYRRYLDMASAEVRVTWEEDDRTFSRCGFVSRKHDMAVWKLECNAPQDLWVRLQLHETGEDDVKKKRDELGDSLRVKVVPPYIYYAGTNDDGLDFGAVARICTDGSMAEDMDELRVSGADHLMVLVRVFVKSGDREASFAAERAFLDAITADSPDTDALYDKLLAEHRALHEPLYRTAALDLEEEPDLAGLPIERLIDDAAQNGASNALLNRLWHYGRYLLICGTRPGGLPFPLYGLYHGRYSMAWPHNMANENMQMIYWHVNGGGLAEFFKPVMQYYLDAVPQYRQNARNMHDLPGIFMPAGTTPGVHMMNQIVPVIMNWIGCAGWVCQHFYSYYQYTGDEKMLREQILPFMKETADFYEAYLVRQPDGFYKIYPSVSPENTPGNLMPPKGEHMAHPCPSAVNATMDIAIIKEVMTNLAEAAELTGMYTDHIEKWQEIAAHLPAYDTTEDGDVREWQWPGLEQRYDHRHLSHIYPMFPGREIVKGVAPKEVTDAFEKAVDKRRLGAQSGWSLAHMASINARFERGDKALDCLSILCRACLTDNLMTLHNDWRDMGQTLYRNASFAPVQLDALMGIAGAMQEMLLFAEPDCIKLLPALPQAWESGRIRLRYMQGEVEMDWNKTDGRIRITFNPERPACLKVLVGGDWAEGLKFADGTPFTNGQRVKLEGRTELHN
ncbi:MAG: glycoside hydrolase N-terminal domain-containing protein [Firmicutes bacterium]|nr:glycoside hydrolase N-terminal domain-containing protein [Bacillota bacterium]